MTFNVFIWSKVCANLREEIVELESRKIFEHEESDISKEEAKLWLDHLNRLCERLNTVEAELPLTVNAGSCYELDAKNTLTSNSYTKIKTVINLKQKLFHILSQTPTTEVNAPNTSSESKLQSRIKKQKFHIEQIESIEINDNACPLEAQVLYDHVGKLYEWFVSNQAEINAQLDDFALIDQQTIALQIQRKVLDIKIRLKKITTPKTSKLDSLVKKSLFLIHQIESIQPKNLVCAEKAKISYDQLASLYDSFLSNQMKIETQFTGHTLEAQRKIFTQVQQNVIESLTNLKKIFEPASVADPLDFIQCRSTTTFSESGSTITQDTHEEMKTPDDIHSSENSSFPTDDVGQHLDISRDIQSDVRSMKEKQKELQEDFKSIKEDFKSMEENSKSTKEDLKSIKNDFKSMKDDSKSAIYLKSIEEDISFMKENLKLIMEDFECVEVNSNSTKEDLKAIKEGFKSIKDDSKLTKDDSKFMKGDLKSINETLKSIKEDLRSIRLRPEYASSQLPGGISSSHPTTYSTYQNTSTFNHYPTTMNLANCIPPLTVPTSLRRT